ncbi:MAG: NAD(P)/FAD-dependent oxidoreductase [Agathobacter sp.]|uniref:NAD(P)/FAD-dependent oxidoreductase n=1 Tax=Agathobacter sp. TaxID=2021311 RepID=UPI00399530ED
MSKVIVVGAGAAGMMAAYFAAKNKNKVTLIEKNEKTGKKIYITGKGRCNITNACDVEDLFANVMSNKKFLYSAFYGFTNSDVIDFFENHGIKTKIERGNRVFPVSDHSSDVISALERALKEQNVDILLNTCVEKIECEDSQVTGVVLCGGRKIEADAVIVATGGMSYQATGSTGDGYRFAEESGHKVTECTPSLVPFNPQEEWVAKLQGLSLKNVLVTIYDGRKKLYEDFGEMLFTHFGVSGPLILSASAAIKQNTIKKPLQMFIDLKPALSYEALDKRILREFDDAKNKQFKNSINKLLPSKMIPVIIGLSGIDPDKKVNEISKGEREGLVNLLKKLPVTLNGTRQWNEAIVTKGGISTKDINPSTMESKIIKNLYFAGEVLDLDALTGGYNLQIAWSTGALAGKSINKEE